ncbi:BTAD domain-containing putative transcriptional regulator [Gryllotalpicola reticulitermitis]|uniref:BTAD domain-containing putative transcriptional regulator n=1 Tax=Gryllotalpicola reticulitermitis TaxID=1184153 RepID=A0ABV8Q3Y9_9MICO
MAKTGVGAARVQVLGPVRVSTPGGAIVDVPGTNGKALIVSLVLAKGAVVSVGSLVDDIWQDEPPRNARAALQTLVSRVRAVAGDELIEYVAGGYRLGTDAVDLWVPGAARRGEPGADLGDTELADRLRETAHAVRTRALESRVTDALNSGASTAAVDAARSLAAAAPFDEHAQLLLMRALAADGRRSEALHVFADYKQRLGDELGARPGPELVAANAALLRGNAGSPDTSGDASTGAGTGADPGADADLGLRGAAAPGTAPVPGTALAPGTEPAPRTRTGPGTASSTGTGTGTSTSTSTSTGTSDHAGRPQASAWGGPDPSSADENRPARTAPKRVAIGLRAAPNQLIGRDSDVAALEELMRSSRLTTILGPGGLGKTRLAHELANRAAQTTPGVVVVELAGIREAEDVPLAVAATFGIGEVGSARVSLRDPIMLLEVRTRIRAALAERETLLVLDNCEHVIEGAAQLVDQVLSEVPSVRVLATSRAPLQLGAESVYPLGSLSANDSRGPAVELFVERARAARPGAALPLDAVARLCEHLDGLPLAIELAAARIRSMSVDEIERRLSNRFALLRGGDRSAPERHRTLIAVIDWSWNLLTESERRMLRRLSRFPDGFSAAAATDVAVAEGSVAPTDAAPTDAAAAAGEEGAADPADAADAADAADPADAARVTRAGTAASRTDVTGAAVATGVKSATNATNATSRNPPVTEEARVQASDDLDALVTQSLVSVSEGRAGLRYRMLETVREFGDMALVDAGEDTLVAAAQARWARGFCLDTLAALPTPGQTGAVRSLEVEHDNLVAVLRAAIEAEDADTIVPIFAALLFHWLVRNQFREALSFTPAVAELVAKSELPAGAPDAAAVTLLFATIMGVAGSRAPRPGSGRGPIPSASEPHSSGDLARRPGDRAPTIQRQQAQLPPEFEALNQLPAGELLRAGVRAGVRLRRLVRSGTVSPWLAEGTELMIAGAHSPHAAVVRLEQLRESRDEMVQLMAYLFSGVLTENSGDLERALGYAREAWTVAERLGLDWIAGQAAQLLANLTSQDNRPEESLAWAASARDHLTAIGAVEEINQSDWTAGINKLKLGRRDGVVAAFDRFVSDEHAAQQDGFDVFDVRAIGWAGLAEIAAVDGNTDEAIELYRRAVSVYGARPGVSATGAWYLISSAGAIAASVYLDRVDDATLAIWRSLRIGARVEVRQRGGPDFVDRPVLATAALGLALGVLAFPQATDAQRTVAAELIALGDRMHSRQDQPMLVRERAFAFAERVLGESAVADARARTAARADLAACTARVDDLLRTTRL